MEITPDNLRRLKGEAQRLPANSSAEAAGDARSASSAARPGRINLADIPWLRSLLKGRWPQLLARSVTLSGFVFTIAAGLFGSKVGSSNFAIIFVWIAWWTALKLVFIPLGGRSWCSVCPIPMPGEWLQRGGLLESRTRRFGLNLRWPRRLHGGWLQWAGFLLVGLFSAVTLTDPRVTAWILLGLFVSATLMGVVFERRAFCTHVCPIGGFTGIYAKTAPIEVRVINASVCAAHSEKICYTNCPWGQYPLALKDSSQCGLCMECLRVCPQDNIAVNLRPFDSDLAKPNTPNRLDEAFLALMMLGSALAFAAVFTGPWGALKTAAYRIGSLPWLAYALGFLALNLVALPGIFGLSVWAVEKIDRNAKPRTDEDRGYNRRPSVARQLFLKSFARRSQTLLPLGLCAWIAFTISFAFPKFSYVTSVLSDPLGWGWNLFGIANSFQSLDISGIAPALQVGFLLLGVFWSAHVTVKLQDGSAVRKNWLQVLPVMAFSGLYSALTLWLLVG